MHGNQFNSPLSIPTIVVPIYSFTLNPSTRDALPTFLGTDFFVAKPSIDQPSLLVTAAHILNAEPNSIYGAIVGTQHPQPIPANLLVADASTDLALFQVPDYAPRRAIHLAQDNEINYHTFVTCSEYSRTDRISSTSTIRVTIATRRGNITRTLNPEEVEALPTPLPPDVLELSFPILPGASGAPVFYYSDSTPRLLGIATANAEYDLRPARIVTELTHDSELLQEIRYLMPQGLAIHVKHLRALLDTLDITYNG
jgi:hypothetical protein